MRTIYEKLGFESPFKDIDEEDLIQQVENEDFHIGEFNTEDIIKGVEEYPEQYLSIDISVPLSNINNIVTGSGGSF